MTIKSVLNKVRKTCLEAINRLLNIGTENTSEEETHVIRIVNLIASIAVPLTIINSIFYINDLGVPPLIVCNTNIPLILLYCITLIWNYFKFSQTAKVWIFCVFLIDMTFSSTLLFGANSDIQWHLILSIPIAFLFWSNKQYIVRYLILAVTLGIFIFIMGNDSVTIAQLSIEEQRLMGISVFINVAIITGLASYMFTRDNEKYRKELSFLAKIDALTGLLSRREFETRFEQQLENLPDNQSCTLILLDVDNFKDINDKYGHAAGDQALIHLANILKKSPMMNAGRIGGDEFCMFVQNTDQSFVEAFVKTIIKELKDNPLYIDHEPVYLSASIGITFETKRRSSDRFFAAADDAMYQIKREGKGSYQFSAENNK